MTQPAEPPPEPDLLDEQEPQHLVGVPSEPDPEFEDLLDHLKATRAFDFTGYKRSSLVRRVQRRMTDVGIEGYDAYRDHLETEPGEYSQLFNTILINVTAFFRDPEAWQYLSDEVVPTLLARRPTGPLRVWSAGCSSGNEAYSLAIALAEAMGVAEFRSRVKIYATDVDDEALAQARSATYPGRDLEGMDPDLRARYFEADGDRWTFRADLRRSVIFGRNDLVQDAPISRIDLLACRNTLMYFTTETQAQILRRLHFALHDEGVLFLGKAEMLLSHGGSFHAIDLKRRFFGKVAHLRPSERFGQMTGQASGGVPPVEALLARSSLVASPLATVVLDADRRVVHVNDAAEQLELLRRRDVGRPFQDLDLSYRPLELRSTLDAAVSERRAVWVRDVVLPRGRDEPLTLDVQVVPLVEADAVLGASLFFHDVSRYRRLQSDLEQANQALETAYLELQRTNEELETTNEELQSTVEELETTNEELQSTNEELETMNEELQSMNDELHSMNDELRERSMDLDQVNVFMNTVLSSLRTGIAVLDRDLRVQAWNARAEDLWGARTEETLGKHLLALDIGLPLDLLRPVLARVLEHDGSAGDAADGAEEIELEAVNRRGQPVTVRVTSGPLRSSDGLSLGLLIAMDQR